MAKQKIEHNKEKATKSSRPVYSRTKIQKPSSFVIGDELEYRVQRLQIYMGYYVRRGRPIYTISNLDRATDLDLLSIRFVEPFRREIIITECKSGKVGPLDRIIWLSGLREYVGAKEALLVRKGTKWNIKEFAKQCNIQVIDTFRINELEKIYKIESSVWPGLSDINFFKTENQVWKETLDSDKKVWELFSTLSSEIKFHEPFPAINYLLSQMRILTKTNKEIPENSFYRHIISECVSQLLIFCMRIAEMSFDLNKEDREGFIKKGLTYGSIEPRYADRILESAYNLTRQSVLHYTGREVEIDKSLFQMPVSPGTDIIIKIVEGILLSYPISLNLPQVCDFLLSELFTKRYSAKGILKTIFPQQNLTALIEMTKWFLKLLVEADTIPLFGLDALTTSKIENQEKEPTTDLSKKPENSNKPEISKQTRFNFNK
jgi:hypothetical protein